MLPDRERRNQPRNRANDVKPLGSYFRTTASLTPLVTSAPIRLNPHAPTPLSKYAMVEPSGDQAGQSASLSGAVVSCWTPLPTTRAAGWD